MINLFCFTWRERIKFFLITFILLFFLEWFIFTQFAPPQTYSYDYLIKLGYFVFISLLLMNSYRFIYIVYGKTLLFFQTFPIRGYQLFFTHLIFSAIEYLLYLAPLFYFAGRSLWNATRLPANFVLTQNENIKWLEGFWKAGLIYLLLLLVIYFCVLVLPFFLSIKNKWIYLAIMIMFVAILLILTFFFQIIGLYLVFISFSIPVFVVANILLIRNFFSPYYV